MPFLTVKVVEGAFDADQKRRLMAGLTDAVEAVYPGLRDLTFVTIEDVKEEQWSIAGEPITRERVAQHARQGAATGE